MLEERERCVFRSNRPMPIFQFEDKAAGQSGYFRVDSGRHAHNLCASAAPQASSAAGMRTASSLRAHVCTHRKAGAWARCDTAPRS